MAEKFSATTRQLVTKTVVVKVPPSTTVGPTSDTKGTETPLPLQATTSSFSTFIASNTSTSSNTASSSSSSSGTVGINDEQPNASASPKPFLKQTASVAAVFTAVGLVVLAAVILAYFKIFRHRRLPLVKVRDVRKGLFRGQWGQLVTPFPSPANLNVGTLSANSSLMERSGGVLVGVDPNQPAQGVYEGADPSEPPPSYSSAYGLEAGSDSASQVSVSEALATASPSSPRNNTEKAAIYH